MLEKLLEFLLINWEWTVSILAVLSIVSSVRIKKRPRRHWFDQ